MPPLSRVGMDLTSGHGYPPVSFVTGATTVYCNNMLALNVGAMHPPHGCPIPLSTVPQFLVSGSSTVFIENKPAGRIGDMDSCPECVTSGSGNVICG